MLGILIGIPISSIIFGGLAALIGLIIAGPAAPFAILGLGVVGVVCGGLIGGPVLGGLWGVGRGRAGGVEESAKTVGNER